REKQIAYNTERGIDPQPLRKKINDIVATIAREEVDTEQLLGTGYRQGKEAKAPVPALGSKAAKGGAKGGAKSGAASPGAVLGDRPATELAGIIEEMTER
ncbi:excinuclease ABC subunit B, partial [Streptomyces sp. SID7499]|nr:excinuclease ABC subunit B [Streptomyces sp. SID7499]